MCPHPDARGSEHWEHKSGWCRLSDNQRAYVVSCFSGKTLQQILEQFTFTFTVDGVTRAFTHEFVRARIGSGFMQHGGRDNDWRHRPWTMPETIRRAVNAYGKMEVQDGDGRKNCIINWGPLDAMIEKRHQANLLSALSAHLASVREIYAALVDAGIPWQDARRILPIGTQTYIHGTFNFVALKGVLANRLEHMMDWEINCVAQLMLREIHIHCPPMFAQALGSHSDLAKKAMFERLESWPPDGKWPGTTQVCDRCGHPEANHHKVHMANAASMTIFQETVCEVCERECGDVAPMHVFRPQDTLRRQHSRVQMPFFVLHPDSMKGADVRWLWTNGNYSDIESQL
jgi:thymidylate synthase ThyX